MAADSFAAPRSRLAQSYVDRDGPGGSRTTTDAATGQLVGMLDGRTPAPPQRSARDLAGGGSKPVDGLSRRRPRLPLTLPPFPLTGALVEVDLPQDALDIGEH